MHQTVVNLYNKALGVIGSQGKLTSTLDNVREAEVCNLFYEGVRVTVHTAFFWASLRYTTRPVLMKERTGNEWQAGDPSPPWKYAYLAPPDMLRPRYFTSYQPFSLHVLDHHHTIQTSCKDPVLVYTGNVQDPEQWEPLLFELVAATLATKVAYALTKKREAVAAARDEWQAAYLAAAELHANQEAELPLDMVPDWIAARDGGLALPMRFIYPVAPLSYATHNLQL